MSKDTREGISNVGVFGPADFGYRKRRSCGGVPTCEPCRRDFAVIGGMNTRSLTNLQN